MSSQILRIGGCWVEALPTGYGGKLNVAGSQAKWPAVAANANRRFLCVLL